MASSEKGSRALEKITTAAYKRYIDPAFTDPKLDAATLKARIKLYGDGGGLWLAVGKGAARSWVFKFSLFGVRDEMGLGSANAIDLKTARAVAKTARELVAGGANPKGERERRADEAQEAVMRTAKSFHELAGKAVLNKEVCGIKSALLRKEWVASMAPHLTDNVTAKAPANISKTDVARAILSIRARGSLAMANKVQRRMWAVFEWCAGNSYISETAMNPAEFVGRSRMLLPRAKPEKATQAAIPWRSIPAVAAALRTKTPRMSALACEWILLSAVRSDCGTSAAWCEIDRVAKVWTIPKSKMKEDGHGDHKVPLTPRMLEILDEVTPPEGIERSDELFPFGKQGAVRKAQTMLQVLRKIYPHLITREDGSKRKASIHGLRSTFRTWGENVMKDGAHAYDEKTLELCMAHVVGDDARNAYVKENNVEVRRAVMEAWSAFLYPTEPQAATASAPSNVVAMVRVA